MSFLKLCCSSPSCAAISPIHCHCGRFSSVGVSTSGRHRVESSPFAEGIVGLVLISSPVRPLRCGDARGFVSCLLMMWGMAPQVTDRTGACSAFQDSLV